MRHILVLVLVVLFSFAISQEENPEAEDSNFQQYISVTGGLPIVNVKYGFNAFGDGGDLRFRLGINPIFGFAVNAGVDSLFSLNPNASEGLYAGGGIGAIYRSTSINTGYGESLFTIGATTTLGNESHISDTISFVTEASFGVDYTINATNNDEGSNYLSPAIRFDIGVKFDL